MVSVNAVCVWIHVSLVICILGRIVMTQNSSITLASSMESNLLLTTETSPASVGMNTATLYSSSDITMVTKSPVVNISTPIGHGTANSPFHTIQPTATKSDIGSVSVSSRSDIMSAVSTDHPTMTSSLSYSGVVTLAPSVSEITTQDARASVVMPGTSQVMSSISTSPEKGSSVLGITSSLASQNLSDTEFTSLVDRPSAVLSATPLLSSTRAVLETKSPSHALFTSGSFQSLTPQSKIVTSSLSSPLIALSKSSMVPSLFSSLSPSSSLPQSQSSGVLVDATSPGKSTSVEMITELVSPTQAISISSSITVSTIDNMSISPTTIAHVQSSASSMSSAMSSLLPSSYSQESLGIQTTRTIAGTLLSTSDHVTTIQTKSEVTSTPLLTSQESSMSHTMQSASFEQTTSSSVDKMTYTTSLQEPMIPTATSSQPSLTSTTFLEMATTESSSGEIPYTSVIPEPFSTLLPSTSSSHVELSTSVATSSKSPIPEHSTTPLNAHSITPLTPTIVTKNISFEIEFKGVCNPLVQRKMVLEIFWEELVITIAKTLRIDSSDIKPKDIACRPIRISFIIMETARANVTQALKTLITSGALKFKIPVLIGGSESKYQYEAVSVKEVPLNYDISGTPDLYEIGLNKVDIIVIIVACCVSFILICVGCCICLREYYIRKRSRSFDLSDIVNFNLKLEDYTLTKIPRNKPFYSDNSVKMQSFTRKNGQQTKSLLEQEENCNCDDVNVRKEVKVRMNSHSDGIVIGVTATSIPDVVTNHQTSHDDQTDQSKEILFGNESSPTHCMDNPIYYADDDRFTAV